jgi:hypothetical protein
MNNTFDFSQLTNLTPVELPKAESKPKGIKATPKNPTGMKLRIFRDGSIFPSAELVEKFNLEYVNKAESQSEDNMSNGFDIWSSKDWGQYPKEAQQVVFIAAVSKSEPKVSVFASVDYNSDGTPKKSVLNQGSKRPEIVEMLREVYNLPVFETEVTESESGNISIHTTDKLFGSKNYVDLDVNTEVKVFEGLPAYYIPKEVKKGNKAGTMSYETRTGLTVSPLTISQEVTEEVVEEVENKELDETV